MPIFEDPLILIAIALAVFKLTDFFFRQHQQKRIQNWAETITLYLDYTKPLRWFQDVVDSGGLSRGMKIVSVLFLLVSVLALSPLQKPLGVPRLDLLPRFLTISTSILQVALVLAFGRRTLDWMLKGYSPKRFIFRYALLSAALGAALIGCQYLVWTLAWLIQPGHEGLLWFYHHANEMKYEPTWWLYVIYSLTFPPIIFGFILLGVGDLVFLAVVTLATLQIFFKLFVGIAYRLVEWKTGVVSAIGTVLAATLSLLDALLRAGAFKNPQIIYAAITKSAAWLGVFLFISIMLGFDRLGKLPNYRRWAAAASLGSLLMAGVLLNVGIGVDSMYRDGLASCARLAALLMLAGFAGCGVVAYVETRNFSCQPSSAPANHDSN